jgi:hypothetical protein
MTLVDLTETGVTKGSGELRDQQRNWETVLQLLGLKTQPLIVQSPVCFKNENLEFFGNIKGLKKKDIELSKNFIKKTLKLDL